MMTDDYTIATRSTTRGPLAASTSINRCVINLIGDPYLPSRSTAAISPGAIYKNRRQQINPPGHRTSRQGSFDQGNTFRRFFCSPYP